VACILGLTDLFGVAFTMRSINGVSGQSPLALTHWKTDPLRRRETFMLYDSAPHGSPKHGR